MSEPSADDSKPSEASKRSGLPPMFGPIKNGKRTWISVREIDYELMGYVLSCHLIIEHYMDAFLRCHHPELEWEGAKLNFAQRVALLSSWKVDEPFNPIQGIKHLNKLRNCFGHEVDYQLKGTDLLPFVHYLQGIRDHGKPKHERGKGSGPRLKDSAPIEILREFTTFAATAFAGAVSLTDLYSGRTQWKVE